MMSHVRVRGMVNGGAGNLRPRRLSTDFVTDGRMQFGWARVHAPHPALSQRERVLRGGICGPSGCQRVLSWMPFGWASVHAGGRRVNGAGRSTG